VHSGRDHTAVQALRQAVHAAITFPFPRGLTPAPLCHGRHNTTTNENPANGRAFHDPFTVTPHP
jgi:hypothetical protein